MAESTFYNPFEALKKSGGTAKQLGQAASDYKVYGRANEQWTNYWEPQWEDYSAKMQRELQTAYERSASEARARLGYGLSMSGSGEGGLAEASRVAFETEAQNKKMDIASQRDIALQNAYMQFMTTKDAQAFEMAKMQANYQYNVKLSEMNEPSWWESLGGILGMATAFSLPSLMNRGGGSTAYSGYQGAQYMNSIAPSGAMYF